MATKTKSKTTTKRSAAKRAPTKAAPTKADLKAREEAHLAKSEARLVEKHGDKIVPGSIKRGTGRHEGKLTVEVRTRNLDGDFDGKTLRVATSDVFQVSHQPEVLAELRKIRAAERRAAKKASA